MKDPPSVSLSHLHSTVHATHVWQSQVENEHWFHCCIYASHDVVCIYLLSLQKDTGNASAIVTLLGSLQGTDSFSGDSDSTTQK